MLDFPASSRVPYWTAPEIDYALQQLRKLDALMATLADLTAAVQQINVKVDALIAAYEAAKNNPATRFSPEDQSALDAAVAGLHDQLAEVDTSNPAEPEPEPVPEPTP